MKSRKLILVILVFCVSIAGQVQASEEDQTLLQICGKALMYIGFVTGMGAGASANSSAMISNWPSYRWESVKTRVARNEQNLNVTYTWLGVSAASFVAGGTLWVLGRKTSGPGPAKFKLIVSDLPSGAVLSTEGRVHPTENNIGKIEFTGFDPQKIFSTVLTVRIQTESETKVYRFPIHFQGEAFATVSFIEIEKAVKPEVH